MTTGEGEAPRPSPHGTTGRAPMLRLPTRILLTRRGVRFFSQNNKTINRFHSTGSDVEYGISLDSFTAASVQRMVQLGFVSRLEVTPRVHVAKDENLLDLGKLLIYAMLYFQFDTRVYDEVFESDLIVRWNRRHMRSPIDRDTVVSDVQLSRLLEARTDVTDAVWKDILSPVFDEIRSDRDLRPGEEQIQIFTAEKFVKNLRPFIWYLLARFFGSDEYLSLAVSIRQILQQYRKRTGIADYVALVTREVVANAQNIVLQDFSQEQYANAWQPARLLYDRAVRDTLLQEMATKDKLVSVSWGLASRSSETPGLNNLRITVRNEQPENLDIPSPNDDRTVYDRRKSLREYYADIPETITNTELALYYYTYLADACRRRDIRFESAVLDSRRTNDTVVNLSFQF